MLSCRAPRGNRTTAARFLLGITGVTRCSRLVISSQAYYAASVQPMARRVAASICGQGRSFGRRFLPMPAEARPVRARLCRYASNAHANRFRLEIIVEHLAAHLPAPARLLVAAERQSRIEDVVAIDPNGAGTQFIGDPMRALDIGGPQSRGQAIDRIVGAPDEFVVDLLERHHGDDRSEDLLLIDAHRVRGSIEHRGLDEKSGFPVAFAA